MFASLPLSFKVSYGKKWKHSNSTNEYLDDRVLIGEIAQFFNVSRDEMPAIVFSGNLWSDEVVVLPCLANMDVVGMVLRHLTEMARRPYRLDDWSLAQHFQRAFPNARTTDPQRHMAESLRPFCDSWHDLSEAKNVVMQDRSSRQRILLLQQLALLHRRSEKIDFEQPSGRDLNRWEQRWHQIGLLLARYALPSMMESWISEPPWVQDLDQVSRSKVLSVLYARNQLQLDSPLIEDFSGFLVGLWGAVERLLNLSLIQLARQAKGIPMPQYYAAFQPDVPRSATTFRFNNQSYNVNKYFSNSAIGGDLAMYMLGQGRVLCEHIYVDTAEESLHFSSSLTMHLEQHSSSAERLFKMLLSINQARNEGCHSQLIDAEVFHSQWEMMLDSELFQS